MSKSKNLSTFLFENFLLVLKNLNNCLVLLGLTLLEILDLDESLKGDKRTSLPHTE
jgi:hypothetical protein